MDSRNQSGAGPGRLRFTSRQELSECSFPDLLERPEVPIPTASERELPLPNPMGKLDAGQRNSRTPERLKACHRGAAAFDRSMILLNEIVEVLATPYLNVFPLRILPPQKPKGQVALLKAIECYLARPPRQTRRQRFAEECLGSGDASIWAKQKIHCLAVLVDSPIEKVPPSPDLYIGLIHAPGSVHGPREAVPSLLELRHIANHPTINRRMRHDDAALGHHCHEISIAQPVGDVPADTQLDDFRIEAAPAVQGVSGNRPGHSGISSMPELYDNAL